MLGLGIEVMAMEPITTTTRENAHTTTPKPTGQRTGQYPDLGRPIKLAWELVLLVLASLLFAMLP